ISTNCYACLLEHGVSSCCRSVEGTTTTMSRKRTCRVLDEMTVEFRLSQLNDILQRTVETMRGDDVIQGKKAMAILQNWCGENCSFEKVFGSVRGMLPATAPGRNTPNLPRLDRYATALIPERLRHIWEAWFVETDGNCLWRALAKAL
ncbi:unnamed protein product, partial [Pylaiella littoralis]